MFVSLSSKIIIRPLFPILTQLPTIRYLPQAWLNYVRKSVKGFSSLGIIIKLVGASFLLVNAILTQGRVEVYYSIVSKFKSKENYPVIAYGLVNVLQHSVFLVQYVFAGNLKTRFPNQIIEQI